MAKLGGWIADLPADSPIRGEFGDLHILTSGADVGTTGDDLYFGDASANFFAAGNGNDQLDGGAGDDTLNGEGGNDVLLGRDGNDRLSGGDGDDTLVGGAGDDTLWGGTDNDTLDGGAGNDMLDGWTGNNTYLFGFGDGQHVVVACYDTTPARVNTVQFKDGVTSSDVKLSRNGDDLVITLAGNADSVDVRQFFSNDDPTNGWNPVQQLAFADGTTWGIPQIESLVFAGSSGADNIAGTLGIDTISGGAGDDAIDGRAGDDVLSGGDGNDTLWGGSGNDTLDGGTGNDTLDGGSGNNTYLFGFGDGQDVITSGYDASAGRANTVQFKTGVASGDVKLSRNGDELVITLAGTTDAVHVRQFFSNDDPTNGWNPVQQLAFSDGTTWGIAQIEARLFAGTSGADSIGGTAAADTISGGAGDDAIDGRAGDDVLSGGDGSDTLWGGSGNDVLDGGAGNDNLNGGSGDNTYLFGFGDGNDIVMSYYDGTTTRLNTIQFKPGVTPSDVKLTRNGEDLMIALGGTGDSMLVRQFLLNNDPTSGWNSLQQFRFADGTIWNIAQIEAVLSGGTSGNDNLVGGNGDDTLAGGAGDDTLNGGYGNNTYVFNRGDGKDWVAGVNDSSPGKVNTLKLGAGITPDDLVLTQVSDHWNSGQVALQVGIAGTADQITFTGFFWQNDPSNSWNSLQAVQFADGTKWNLQDIVAKVFSGASGDDLLTGTVGSDSISGGAGNDTIYGGQGDDTLSGGAGNDTLEGDYGNNTYVFNRGDGQDWVTGINDASPGKLNTLKLGAGIGPDDLVLEAVSDHWNAGRVALKVGIAGTTDRITFTGFFWQNDPSNSWNSLQQVQFADGTTWGIDQLVARTKGSDIVGTDGDDTLAGAAGADSLSGGAGNDTYQFGRGSGRDTIVDTAGNDVVRFGSGIATSDVSFLQSKNDLEIDLVGSADALIVKNWYSADTNHVEQFQFADGSTILDSQVQGLVHAMAVFNAQAASTDAMAGASQQARVQDTPVLVAHAG